MSTATSTGPTVQIRQVVDVVLERDEYMPTQGDRKPGSRHERRTARIVRVTCKYAWLADRQCWSAGTADIFIEQQRADGSWGEAKKAFVYSFTPPPGVAEILDVARPMLKPVIDWVDV